MRDAAGQAAVVPPAPACYTGDGCSDVRCRHRDGRAAVALVAPMASSPTDRSLPPEAWGRARRAAVRLVSPLQRFLAIEAASGVVLIVAALIALGWANSPWRDAYAWLWHQPIGVVIGDWGFVRPLHFWVNDGLMTVFFFVVGLEIRREVYEGELAEPRRAAVPFAAALGGMLVPAAIYLALNLGHAGADGWGVPMATDIAFAVGVLALLGARVSAGQRILLLALAVIDDIGAIVVIALFYSAGIDGVGLLVMVGAMVGVLALRWLGVRSPLAYVTPAVAMWAGLLVAGVHPTLAGVVLGLLTPARSWFGPAGFAEATAAHLDELAEASRHDLMTRLDAIERARREAVSPVEHLLHALHPVVAFGIMPLFALANAGVALDGAELSGAPLRVFLGVLAGLVVGKPLGIVLATKAARALGGGAAGAPPVLVVGLVGGIGFTMSIFIAQLAFPPGPLLETAKLAVLVASGTASLAGLAVGRWGSGAHATSGS